MTIEFNQQDKQLIREALEGAELRANAADARRVADVVRAAFVQQFEYEANYLIVDMADEGALVASVEAGRGL
jgi:hypothetical protein